MNPELTWFVRSYSYGEAALTEVSIVGVFVVGVPQGSLQWSGHE